MILLLDSFFMYLGILILSFMHLFIQQEYIDFACVTHSAAG